MMYYFALKVAGIIMSVFATNYTVFVVGRFCIGCGHVGYHHPGFVLGNAACTVDLQRDSLVTVYISCSNCKNISLRCAVWSKNTGAFYSRELS